MELEKLSYDDSTGCKHAFLFDFSLGLIQRPGWNVNTLERKTADSRGDI